MADNIWDNSDADNDGNVAANWSLNQVPTGTDVAVFDSATTDANCTFSAPISCAGMRFDNTYAGTVDAATFAITLGASGLDCTGGGSATLDLGSGTWTVNGDFDYGDIGTLDDGSSTVVMAGSGKELIGKDNIYLYNLTISDSTTIPAASGEDLCVAFNLTVNASLEITTGKWVKVIGAGSTLDVGAAGDINGAGSFLMSGPTTGGINTMSGAIQCTQMTLQQFDAASLTLPAVSYGATTTTLAGLGGARAFKFSAGTTTFAKLNITLAGADDTTLDMSNAPDITITGNLTMDIDGAGDLIVDCSTKDVGWIVQGDVIDSIGSTGVIIYTKGTGSWTFSGGNNQALACNMFGTMEVITIDKSGNTATLGDALACDGMVVNGSGASGFDAATFAVTLGASGLDCSGGALSTLDLGSGTWTCSGDWDYGDIGTLDDGSSTVVMAGSGKELVGKHQVDLFNLTISDATTMPAASGADIDITNNLTVNASLEITSGKDIWLRESGTTLDIGASGDINGPGRLGIVSPGTGGGINTQGGTIQCAEFNLYYFDADSLDIPAATYAATLTRLRSDAGGNTFTFAGTTTISGNLELFAQAAGNFTLDQTAAPDITVTGNLIFNLDSSGDVIIDCSAKDVDWVVQGDVVNELSSTGVVTYTAGTGSWTFSGGNNQALACNMLGTMETITIDKSGNTATLGDALACDGMVVNGSGASGFDAATFAVTLGASGLDCSGGALSTLDLGSGTWTCSGDWDYGDIGTLDDGTSTVVMAGSGKDLIAKTGVDLYNLTISDATTVPAASGASIQIVSNLTVNASLDVTSGKQFYLYTEGVTLDVGGSGDINGAGRIHITYPRTNGGIATQSGTIQVAELYLYQFDPDSLAIPAATYDATQVVLQSGVGSRTFTHSAGTTTYSGNVLYLVSNVGDLTISNSTNNPTLVFQGDVTVTESSSGNLVWNGGSGGITFSGGNNQSIGLDEAGTLELVTIDKSGNTATLTDAMTTLGMVVNGSGASGFDAATFAVTLGASGLDCSGGALSTLDLGSGTWTCSGDFDWEDIGTWTYGSALVVMTGNTATLTSKSSSSIAGLTIQTGADITFGNNATILSVRGPLIVNAPLDIDDNHTITVVISTLNVGAAGVISGTAGNLIIADPQTGGGIQTMDGDITTLRLYLDRWAADSLALPAKTYNAGTVRIQSSGQLGHIIHAAGTTTFSNDVSYEVTGAADLTIANADFDPNLVFQGDVTITESSTGNLIWNEGSGGITFSGGNNQNIGLDEAGTLELVTVDKSGNTATLTDGLTTLGMVVNGSGASGFDAATFAVTLGASGLDCSGGGSATLDLGSSTWTVNGDFDYGDIGSLDDGSSTVVMAGSGKELIGKNNVWLYNLTISDSTTIPVASGANIYIANNLAANDSLEITSAKVIFIYGATASLDVGGSGDINGAGTLYVRNAGAAGGINTQGGVIQCTNLTLWDWVATSQALPAATYDSQNVWFLTDSTDMTLTFSAGTTTFSGDVVLQPRTTGNLTISNAANPTLVFQGDVTVTESSSGNLVWNGGSGGITFSGGNNQSVGLAEAGNLETTTINKRLPLSDTDEFTEVDPNGRCTITDKRIDSAGLARNESAYTYTDMGAGNIGDFRCRFEVETTSVTSLGTYALFGISNVVKDMAASRTATDQSVWVYWNDDNIFIIHSDEDAASDAWLSAAVNTPYFVEVVVSGTDFRVYIRTGSHAGTLVDTIFVALPGARTYRYLYVCNTYNDGAGGHAITGYTQNYLYEDASNGVVTLTTALSVTNFIGTAGSFDPNGQTITTQDDCTWSSGFDFANAADVMNGCTWTVGKSGDDDFSCDGQTCQATASWTLTVAGSATAVNTDVEYSDASGGTQISAIAASNTDSGNNSNWLFGYMASWYYRAEEAVICN